MNKHNLVELEPDEWGCSRCGAIKAEDLIEKECPAISDGEIYVQGNPIEDPPISSLALLTRGIMIGMTGALGIVWVIVEIFGP